MTALENISEGSALPSRREVHARLNAVPPMPIPVSSVRAADPVAAPRRAPSPPIAILRPAPRNRSATVAIIAAPISGALLVAALLLGIPVVTDLPAALVGLIAAATAFRAARNGAPGMLPALVGLVIAAPVTVYAGWTIIAFVLGIPTPGDIAQLDTLVGSV
ncbi:hypothetical protein [Pseudolysinimonas sp.]|uniref:hypothetical protein n=1 Tax=Pseudolysinimonas sp. TaxID=2680009 RepID=UPI003F7DF55A